MEMKCGLGALSDPLTALMTVLLLSMALPALTYPLEDKRAQPYPQGLVEKRASIQDGAPKRPEQFHSVEELNRYLTALTDYYNVLGRPRFGKRSDSLQPTDTRYNELPLLESDMESDINSRLNMALLELLLSRDRQSDRV